MGKLMKGTALATAVCGLLLAAPAAMAGDDHHHHHRHHRDGWNYAKVLDVVPIYREVRVRGPREVCHEEPVTERVVHRGHSDPGAVLVGAVIGGVIGHQFGSGRGNDIATAAGAVIGAHHGARHSYHGTHVSERTVYETHCHTTRHARWERVPDGYEVTYKYRGQVYHTRTDEHPGRRIRVRWDGEPWYRD